MSNENYIVDTPLPLELDFKSLKSEGLAYIQKHSSTAWTNLNPSDPGVTILEQLCYAFTELGYCANFSMKDILTNANGNLTVENQFFVPQQILTTTPITLKDYTKCIIDGIPSVKNAIVIPIPLTLPFVSGVYQVYIQLSTSYDDPSVINAPVSDTYFLLNSYRNVGEWFLPPKILVPKKYTITGNLVLDTGYDLNTILPKIVQKINNYVFPEVTQTGYDTLKKKGESINDIFNGPSLENGWISSSSLLPKKDTIQAFEITKIIHDVEGVSSISKVKFSENNTTSTTATCNEDEILTFDFSSSLTKNTNAPLLEISAHGKHLNTSLNTSLIDELASMQSSDAQANEVASVQMAPQLPSGKFRDITSYYSIQHTFPEVYAVGLNATNQNTPTYQVAQSRQLKGYLSLFDQMLSNQFAQLANIDKLFSFKNASTGSPADLENYNNTKTAEEKINQKYPVPFEVFSPTYFYQSLYGSVPNIEPLLRNNSIFKFGPVYESQTTLEHKNWTSYQDDPYNSYMYGLLIINEDETVNLTRRNQLLDHLLARHGESPLVIDTLINGTVYSGDMLKDRVIIKSLYLQNFDILSYNRTKAYNVIGASKLSSKLLEITDTLINDLAAITTVELFSKTEKNIEKNTSISQEQLRTLEATYKAKKELQQILTKSYQKNGVFDSARVDEEEKITTQNTLDYTTVSLKLNILLTLRPFYVNFIQSVVEKTDVPNDKKETLYDECAISLWLITQRKGMISIETNILLQSGKFQLFIRENTLSKTYYRLNTILMYNDFVKLSSGLSTMSTQDITTYLTTIDSSYALEKIESSSVNEAIFTPIGNTGYAWTANVSWNEENTIYITDSLLSNSLLWIFPDFIPEINAADWQYRLSYFIETELDLQVTVKTLNITAADMKTLIPAYANWYNANIYNAETETINSQELASATSNLISILSQISINA
ncbi:hypothetical protein [Kordia zhangzhouensis]|uniref:hypothetical protein n=1 Tax=Kordia zhangzhouensis TaxID=1620405 RepID=UPI0006294E09|nr:hypothetical protein [Kordia zhangzhouensis]